MPIHNGASSLPEVLDGLHRQVDRELVAEILFVDDGSTDGSRALIEHFGRHSGYRTRVIRHAEPQGLAASYNEGILAAGTRRVVLMHQDVVLPRPDSFERIGHPLAQPGVGSAHPAMLHPADVWRTYPFWQKCLFSRHVGRARHVPSGKFDIYERHVLMDIGLFDAAHYRTAGEDGDLNARLVGAGLRLARADVEVVHIHTRDPHFGLADLYRKEAQIAEAYGVLLRHRRLADPQLLPFLWFRQLILLALLIKPVRKGGVLAAAAYAYAYTARVYRTTYRDPRVLALPWVNLSLIPVTTYYALRGLVTGRQRL